MNYFQSTKTIELGSCAFRQWRAKSHCKFVHGYQLIAKFWFGASELDDKNWVVDFASLKQLKQILNNQFDHTLCIAQDDPLLPSFIQLHDSGGCDLRIMDGVGIEKTAEWCLKEGNKFVKELTNNRCWVESVEVFEHELNSAIAYSRPYNITIKKVNIESVDPINNTPAATVTPQHAFERNPTGAPVGNQPTTGLGNLFGGTSWGS